MAEERFQDKALAKKDEAKIKGDDVQENQNPREHKAEATQDQKTPPVKTAKTEKTEEKKEAKDAKAEKPARKVVLERKYTVNLAEAYAKPKYKRQDRAVLLLREFALRHMKGNKVAIEPELNNAIRTSARPQKKMQVLLQKDEAGTVHAALAQKTG